MKRSDLVFTSLLVPVDFCMLMLAGFASYFLRFETFAEIRPILHEIPLSEYALILALVSMGFIAVFGANGLYNIGLYRIKNEMPKVVNACSSAILLAVLIIFFIPDLFSSRFLVLSFWILGIILVISARALLRAARYLILKKGLGAHKIVIIGTDKATDRIVDVITKKPGLGYKVVKQVTAFNETTAKEIESLVKKGQIDELFLLKENVSQEEFQHILDFADLQHIEVRYSAEIIGGKQLEISTLAGIPLVEIRRTKLDGWGRIFKRLFDIIGSLFLIILFSPLMLIAAIAVFIETGKPIIYKNERVGQKGNFIVYKFRSMFIEDCTGDEYGGEKAEKLELDLAKKQSKRQGPVFKVLNDPRRTKVGRFLEKTSIDELPQFFNVLMGNMSLVGPRPHIPVQVADYEQHHHKVFAIKPGVTGLAQIVGRSDLDFEEEFKLDEYYIENWSLLMDLSILIKTPWSILTRKSQV